MNYQMNASICLKNVSADVLILNTFECKGEREIIFYGLNVNEFNLYVNVRNTS